MFDLVQVSVLTDVTQVWILTELESPDPLQLGRAYQVELFDIMYVFVSSTGAVT